MERPHFEYLVRTISGSCQKVMDELDDLWKEGWELVVVVEEGNRFIFKKQREW